jgi:hypothetical protein
LIEHSVNLHQYQIHCSLNAMMDVQYQALCQANVPICASQALASNHLRLLSDLANDEKQGEMLRTCRSADSLYIGQLTSQSCPLVACRPHTSAKPFAFRAAAFVANRLGQG